MLLFIYIFLTRTAAAAVAAFFERNVSRLDGRVPVRVPRLTLVFRDLSVLKSFKKRLKVGKKKKKIIIKFRRFIRDSTNFCVRLSKSRRRRRSASRPVGFTRVFFFFFFSNSGEKKNINKNLQHETSKRQSRVYSREHGGVRCLSGSHGTVQRSSAEAGPGRSSAPPFLPYRCTTDRAISSVVLPPPVPRTLDSNIWNKTDADVNPLFFFFFLFISRKRALVCTVCSQFADRKIGF